MYLICLILFLLVICLLSTVTIYNVISKNIYINKNISQTKNNIQVEKILELTKIYMNQKRWLSCILLLEKNSITKDPFIENYYNIIGFCYYHLKIYTLSEYYYNQAIREQPTNIIILCNLGRVYVKNKKYKQAISVYRKVLQIEDNNKVAQKELKILLKT